MSNENSSPSTSSGRFVNPYNFVALPPRPVDGPLADGAPSSHAVFDGGPDRWSGSIPIRVRALTPILIPDQARATLAVSPKRGANGRLDPSTASPKIAATRKQADDKSALLLGSSLKGMLRSSFEAVTNSRMGVVSSVHAEPLSMRRPAKSALKYPGRVTKVDGSGTDAKVHIQYILELSSTDLEFKFEDFLPSVWVPQDFGKNLAAKDELDGLEVEAWIHPYFHPPRGRNAGFHYWRVTALVKREPNSGLGDPPEQRSNRSASVKVGGYLHWTGGWGPGKHDERLYVEEILSGPAILETDEFVAAPDEVAAWNAVISAYVSAHEGETNPKLAAYTNPSKREQWSLREGRTLYVETLQDDRFALHPAMIGRDAFPKAPIDFIPSEHRPSVDRAKLSPAERVFGWIPPSGSSSRGHRGHLRIDPPRFRGQIIPTNAQLAALSGPKPSQYRFYLGQVEGEGGAVPLGSAKQKNIRSGYADEAKVTKAIRGRKFYGSDPDLRADVTQSEGEKPFRTSPGAGTYWKPTAAGWSDEVNLGSRVVHREYLGHRDSPAHVAMKVSDWIQTGAVFETTLRVDNISSMELGALLWLLSLPDDCALRLGYGKPLGFGVAHVEVDRAKVRLWDGDGMATRYGSLRPTPEDVSHSDQKVDALVEEFDSLLSEGQWRGVRDQFLWIARGTPGVPVHYPRAESSDSSTSAQPDPFGWWKENERTYFRSLPAPSADPALPIYPAKPR